MPIPEACTLPLDPMIEGWLAEIRELLVGVPTSLRWEWDNNQLVPEQGVGGACITPELIHLSFDPDFVDKKKQLVDLRASLYHEVYHTVQGWSFFEGKHKWPQSAVSVALMEGIATAFEREHANGDISFSTPKQGEDMENWYQEIKSLPLDYDHLKYRFYDPESGRINILYKIGLWLVDGMLAKDPSLELKNMAHLSPQELENLI